MDEKIGEAIMRYLEKQDWPVTTEMIATAVKVSWNTAQVHLYKLTSEGKVKGKRVGRQNQWITIRKSK